VEHRVSNIVSAATERVFCYACLGLFERHKLMFASHLSLLIKVLPPPLVPHICYTAADRVLSFCRMYTPHACRSVLYF